jgi:REP element-mobilizing transposase RayT
LQAHGLLRSYIVVAELAGLNIANQSWQIQKLWQPNYYEHIIRNEKALEKNSCGI